MDEVKPYPATSMRRDEDIALDLMRFIAEGTNYAKAGIGTGFQGSAGQGNEEHQAERLLQLYRRCLGTVRGKP
jgi:hypothetical protein